MKKRLRKKKHLKEFRDTYFDLTFEVNTSFGSEEREKFYDDFLNNLIIPMGLCATGSLEPEIDLSVGPYGRGQVHNEERAAICEWLEQQGTVTNIQAGKFKDAWYPFQVEA